MMNRNNILNLNTRQTLTVSHVQPQTALQNLF